MDTKKEFIGAVFTPEQEESLRIHSEMQDILKPMSIEETLTLMFTYMREKLSDATGPNDPDDPEAIPLTPTGEDIIVWGDRVADELEAKLIELRSI